LERFEARVRRIESQPAWWYHSIETEPGQVAKGMGFLNVSLVRDLLRDVDVQGCRCLDLGCADGLVSILVARRGAAQVIGWDRVPRRNFLGLIRRWPDLPLQHACDSSFTQVGGVFDVVVLAGLLYHVLDPLRVLLQARSKVRNGGVLLLETAAICSPERQLDFNAAGRFYARPEQGDYWLPHLGLLDYLLRLCRLIPVRASWFLQDQGQHLCRVAVACRAVDQVDGLDAWLEYHQRYDADSEPGRTLGEVIDWRVVQSDADEVVIQEEQLTYPIPVRLDHRAR
jgi:SAM-dependent methyltransferase